MGVVSRRVVPACAAFCCCFCPGMRARSRRPIKRYNLFLSAIFKGSEDGMVNEKPIGKLADYAEENPDRIPSILKKLEERADKDLKAARYGSLPAVAKTYWKLLSSCQEHMPLLAGSTLGFSKKLLESKSTEMRQLGCATMSTFLDNQTDALFASAADAKFPAVLAVAREPSSPNQGPDAKASALDTLRSYICYSAQHERVLPQPTWDQIVGTVLDCYTRSSGADSAVIEARDSMRQQIELGRTSTHKAKGGASWKDFPQLPKESMQQPAAASLTCMWATGLLFLPANGASPLAQAPLRSILAYISNGGYWSPLTGGGLGASVLSDLRDGVQLAGGKIGRERQTELQLIQQLTAILTEPGSVVPASSQEGALRALSNLLKGVSSPPTQAVTGTSASSGIPSANGVQEGAPKVLQRVDTLTGPYAVPEVLTLQALTLLLSNHIATSPPPQGEAEGAITSAPGPGQGGGAEGAVTECSRELARIIGTPGVYLDALGVTLQGVPASADVETRSTVQAVRSVAAAGLPALGDVQIGGPGGTTAGVGVPEDSPDCPDCPGVLFYSILQVMSHPDPEVRTEAHKLASLLFGGSEGTSSSAPIVRRPVALNWDQSRLLLAAMWSNATDASAVFNPASFVALHSSYVAAIRPGGSGLLEEAARLALSIRASAASPLSSAPPPTRRSLLTLSAAILLSAKGRIDQRGLGPNQGSTTAGNKTAGNAFTSIVMEGLPKDPYLIINTASGSLAEARLAPGTPAFGSAEDSAKASAQLSDFGPEEKDSEVQRRIASELALSLANYNSKGAEGPLDNDDGSVDLAAKILGRFEPAPEFSTLKSLYLDSARDLPPSASPSVALGPPPDLHDLEGSFGPSTSASQLEKYEDSATASRQAGSAGAPTDVPLPSVDDIIRSLAARPNAAVPSSSQENSRRDSVSRALAILGD